MREFHQAHSASDGNSNESRNHQDEWGSSQMKYHDVIDSTLPYYVYKYYANILVTDIKFNLGSELLYITTNL